MHVQSRIPVIPPPGTYQHAVYGPVTITSERIRRFVNNVNVASPEIGEDGQPYTRLGVYGHPLPLDFFYGKPLSGAIGWLSDLQIEQDGGASALVSWSPNALERLKKFKVLGVAPEWYDSWNDTRTTTIFQDVLVGASLTTAPFFQELQFDVLPVIASLQEDANTK